MGDDPAADLRAALAALDDAAQSCGATVERVPSTNAVAAVERGLSEMSVTLHGDARAFWTVSNGLCLRDATGAETTLWCAYRAPPLSALARAYRRVWASPSDRVAALDRVFPVFISDYGEFLGVAPDGADSRLYEVSMSNPDPRLAFSSLSRALATFAASVSEATASDDAATARRVHERIDPLAAQDYWD